MTKEERNKLRKKESDKKWYQANKKKIAKTRGEYLKKWRSLNKDKQDSYSQSDTTKEYKKNWYLENKNRLSKKKKEYAKTWYQSNKKEQTEKKLIYRKNNKDAISISGQKYRAKNKERKNKFDRDRMASDPQFRLRRNLSTLIRGAFKSSGLKKNSKTAIIIGCTFKELREHIETQFKPWMSWNNYGSYKLGGPRTWNIDHIIPVASAKTEEEIIKLNHFSNLRPLCSKENNEKSNKFL